MQDLPHRLMEDEFYRGMRIPKGSMVITNLDTCFRVIVRLIYALDRYLRTSGRPSFKLDTRLLLHLYSLRSPGLRFETRRYILTLTRFIQNDSWRRSTKRHA